VNPSRVFAVVLRQWYLFQGSPQRILPIFLFVAIDILLWGFLTRYLNRISHVSFWVPTLLGAVLLWDFLTRAMQGITTAFFEDVWSRNFLNVFATPMRTSEYLAGLVIIGVVNTVLSLVVMFVMAWTLFGLSFLAYGWALGPFLAVLFITGVALGILGTAMVLRLGPASEWLVWPIPTLLLPFAGAYYPVSALPGWMQAVSRALPPSYVFDGLRAVVAGQPAPWNELAIAAGLACVYLLLACWVFAATYRFAIRTGLIARYSAESVS
jgi:ABC-2 type transport system permease protein